MCELLVRWVDKRNPDPVLDSKRFQAGYVIDIKEDGAVWGSAELNNPEWCILRAPGVPADMCMNFMGRQLPTEPGTHRMLQRRAFRLDPERIYLHDGALVSLRQLQAARVPTDVLDDPMECR